MLKTYLENQLKYCGKITKILIDKILSLNIPENYILSCHCLPTAIGYNPEKNLYFAKQQKERSNDLETIFESSNENDFKFYILELFAKSWGRKFELDNRKDFESLWKFVHDKAINGKWQYKVNPNAKYNAIYDFRKIMFETSISCLLNIYSANDLDEYIKKLTELLNNNRDVPYIIWTYSVKDKEFIINKVIE